MARHLSWTSFEGAVAAQVVLLSVFYHRDDFFHESGELCGISAVIFISRVGEMINNLATRTERITLTAELILLFALCALIWVTLGDVLLRALFIRFHTAAYSATASEFSRFIDDPVARGFFIKHLISEFSVENLCVALLPPLPLWCGCPCPTRCAT